MSVVAESPAESRAEKPGWKADSLAHGVVVLLVLTVVQRLIGFLRGVFFCQWLDVAQLGQWDLAYAFLMLVAPLAALGLPGTFGRYVEYYRKQGQLATFVRRTILCVVASALFTSLVLAVAGPWFSELLFGSAEHVGLVLVLAAALATVIAYNFLLSLFTALRNYKIVSRMQFSNTLIFAVAGVGLVTLWRDDPVSVVVAFAVACVVSSVAAIVTLARFWKDLPQQTESLAQRTFWSKLLPYAFWLWLTNWVANLFEITDRFMIIHYSGLEAEPALDLVGQYHSARLLPLLLVGVADLLASTITPHLSSDWEAGRRGRVSERLNLVMKIFGVLVVAASAAVLLLAPILFQVAFRDKYASGLAILPWTLVHCTWTGLALLAYNYLYCAEKARLVCLSVLVGLVVNVGLNYLLLPALGLQGAVLASATARLVNLGVVCLIIRWQGMTVDRSLAVIAALALALPLGPWATIAILISVSAGLVPGMRIFSAQETGQIANMLRPILQIRMKDEGGRMRI
jgi:O-antigen/teichoic acid export membrane protein